MLRREYLREIIEKHIGSKVLLQVVEEHAGDKEALPVRRAGADAGAAVGTAVGTGDGDLKCTYRTGRRRRQSAL